MANLEEILNQQKGPIEEMFDRKQTTIKESQDKKQNSITEAAIRRDAALFTSVEDGEKDRLSLKKRHEYWLKYFGELYGN